MRENAKADVSMRMSVHTRRGGNRASAARRGVRLQCVHVDRVDAARSLVRLAVAGPVERRTAEAGLDRDLACGLAVAVQLRLGRRRGLQRVLAGRARGRDTGADCRLRLCLDMAGGLRLRLALGLDGDGGLRFAVRMGARISVRGRIHGRGGACVLLTGRRAVRVVGGRRGRPGDCGQTDSHRSG